MNNAILLSFLLCFTTQMRAQPNATTMPPPAPMPTSTVTPFAQNPKMDEFIGLLESTSFIKDYKNFRSDTEAKIMELKLETQLDPKAVGKLRIVYKQSQFKFDAIIDQLKRDLANASTRKLIKKSPELFSEKYQNQLDDAKSYCNNNFHQKADILLGKGDAVDPVTMSLMIDTFVSLFKSFMDKKANDRLFNAAYLDAKLIEPLRFKAWERIE